jgi:hypothetical protein
VTEMGIVNDCYSDFDGNYSTTPGQSGKPMCCRGALTRLMRWALL